MVLQEKMPKEENNMAENKPRSGNDINVFTFSGRLTADAEVRENKNGKKFSTYTVANSPYSPNNPKTNYYDCIQSGDLGWLKKGTQVMVEGEDETTEYTDKNGNKRRGHRIIVKSLSAVSSRNSDGASTSTPANTKPEIGEEVDEDDELPF